MIAVPASDGSAVRLVVFDLGRVLIRICDGWDDAFARAGVAPPVGEFDPLQLRDISCRHDVGELDFKAFAAAVSAATGLAVPHIHAMSRAFLHGPYPGAVELVDELNSRGYATACLSNTNDHHWRLMNDPAEPAYFPLSRLTHRFASHLVRARKPDPAIYAHLERETGAAPGEIVFFDDMPINIEAARNRGWQAYAVDPKSPDPVAFMRHVLAGRRAAVPE